MNEARVTTRGYRASRRSSPIHAFKKPTSHDLARDRDFVSRICRAPILSIISSRFDLVYINV